MNVTIEDLNETRKKVIVSYTGEETAVEEKKLLADFSKQANIPGFRAGKAPVNMIKARFKKQLADEMKRRMISAAYDACNKETELTIYNVIDLEEPEIVPGDELALGFTLDVVADFDLPEYKGIETHVPAVDVADEELDAEIENYRRQRSEFETVEREAQKGDYVKVSYKGLLDGEEFAEKVSNNPIWGTQENTWEEAGAEGDMRVGVPAVIDGILGMSAGDKKEVPMTIPADHEVAELQGKEVVYEVEVHEVRQRILPELDEAFCKTMGAESVEDLKDKLMDQLKYRKEGEVRMERRRQISEALLAAVDFPVPESAVDAETQRVLTRVMQANMQQGVAQEEFEKNKDALFEKAKADATNNVKIEILLGRIADAESLDVEQDDLQKAIWMQAMQSGRKPEEIIKELQKDQGKVNSLRQGVLLDKVMAFLEDACKDTVEAIEE